MQSKRPKITTALLYLMLVWNLVMVVLAQRSPGHLGIPEDFHGLFMIIAFLNMMAVGLVLVWHRLGLYLFCFNAAVDTWMAFSLAPDASRLFSGPSDFLILQGPAGFLLLVFLLQLGSPSAWSQMQGLTLARPAIDK